jgi:hypothetical protein
MRRSAFRPRLAPHEPPHAHWPVFSDLWRLGLHPIISGCEEYYPCECGFGRELFGSNQSSYGHNVSDDATCTFGASSDISNIAAPSDLQNNAVRPRTIALLAGSPAINAGDDAGCAAAPVSNLDQRGFVRPAGVHCDIGAYEYNAIPPVLDTIGPITSNVSITPNPQPFRSKYGCVTLRHRVGRYDWRESSVASAVYSVNGGSASQVLLTPSGAITTQGSASLAPFSQSNVYNVCVHGTDVPGNKGADT